MGVWVVFQFEVYPTNLTEGLINLKSQVGDFLENNYKTQTISLVRKRFKLIWFLTIRVQRTRFLGCYFIILPTVEVVRLST